MDENKDTDNNGNNRGEPAFMDGIYGMESPIKHGDKDMMQRRTELTIFADMLKEAIGGAKKTRIVYNTNTNFKLFDKFARRLIASDMMEETKDEYGKRIFLTTRKGINYIKQYNVLSVPE